MKGLAADTLVCTVQDLEEMGAAHPGVDLLVTVGGDGTILRAAHIAAPHGIAILGINMGRVGFMTELRAEEAAESLNRYLENDLWIEERAMLQARVVSTKGTEEDPCVALNEAVVGNGAISRMITVEVAIDGATLTAYRADSVIVATATGSTGYALSAGGPILDPLSKDILLKPVAAYLGLGSAIILPPSSRVQLTVLSEGPSMLNLDGFVNTKLAAGDQVLVEASPHVARFLRAHPPSHFYATLTKRLGMEPGNSAPSAVRR